MSAPQQKSQANYESLLLTSGQMILIIFLTLVKSKVSDTYTLLTLGKAMCSFVWEDKIVSLIREVLF